MIFLQVLKFLSILCIGFYCEVKARTPSYLIILSILCIGFVSVLFITLTGWVLNFQFFVLDSCTSFFHSSRIRHAFNSLYWILGHGVHTRVQYVFNFQFFVLDSQGVSVSELVRRIVAFNSLYWIRGTQSWSTRTPITSTHFQFFVLDSKKGI